LTSADTGSSQINFGGVTTPKKGVFRYSDNSDLFIWFLNSTAEQMRLTSSLLSVVPGATIQGLTVGRGAGAVAQNTAVGFQALNANTTGDFSTAVGYAALAANTTGQYHTAVGRAALNANTTGGSNSAFGYNSLASNTTGNSNVAVGLEALQANTTASNNTAVGYQAGYANTTGARNVAIGLYARNTPATGDNNIGIGAYALQSTGSSNVAVGDIAMATSGSGSFNTALGAQSLYSNTTASNNTAVGYQAGYSNTTGTGLTAIGYRSLYSNTTGTYNLAAGYFSLYSNTTGASNVAIGGGDGSSNPTLYSNTTGNYNTAVGLLALGSNTTASNNTAVGYQALYTNTTGYGNAIIGFQAGYSNTTGFYNTFIGQFAGYNVTTGSKNTILGSYNGNQGGLDIRTASNYIVLSDGDGNPRQIIDGSGNFFFGTTGIGLTRRLTVVSSGDTGIFQTTGGASSNPCEFWNTATSGDNRFVFFYTESSATARGSIDYNRAGGLTRYNTTSDYRAKDIIGPITDSGAQIDALKVYSGKMHGATIERPMMIAHEAQQVAPYAVSGVKDEVNEDGTPKYQQMDHASLVPLLIAEIQSLRARVAQLEAK
jgi:hypothetical protein